MTVCIIYILICAYVCEKPIENCRRKKITFCGWHECTIGQWGHEYARPDTINSRFISNGHTNCEMMFSDYVQHATFTAD